eukprot:TRINITY_DN30719_c0_g1_i1.p1 TRINITY_DN30719_c0_g1~~TRINITY_DN30719_c0_g1_i1.p1  ORF type:complete len:308 (+),score=70.10 TRINITY_DN30719_c0_g1_i1:64-987(+)
MARFERLFAFVLALNLIAIRGEHEPLAVADETDAFQCAEPVVGLAVARKMPTMFIPHGGCGFYNNRNSSLFHYFEFLGPWIMETYKPVGVLFVSGHWETSPNLTVSKSFSPVSIYDQRNKTKWLYNMSFPSEETTLLMERTCELVGRDRCTIDERRGFDHAVWNPISVMFRGGDVAVAQLSMHTSLDFELHLELGRLLRPLLSEGFMIIGSGAVTHSKERHRDKASDSPAAWFTEFTGWLDEAVMNNDGDSRGQALKAFHSLPSASIAHPREDHFVPLLVAAAAGGKASRLPQDPSASRRTEGFLFE